MACYEGPEKVKLVKQSTLVLSGGHSIFQRKEQKAKQEVLPANTGILRLSQVT